MEFQAPSSNVKDLHEILKESGHYLGNLIGKDYQKFATKYNFALKYYLYAKSVSLSKVKMAFFSSQVVELNEIYVPQNIKWNNEIFSQVDFFDLLLQYKKVVVSATAGSGKSCFLKSLFLDIISNEKKLLPLFLELRKVNETGESIFENLRLDIAIHNSSFNESNLDYLLSRKGTVLFLDGFDEVNYDLKDKYLEEVNYLANKYTNLIILASSRQEYNEFRDWSLYDVVYLEPLTLLQSIKIIEKLNYNIETKERFIKALNSGLYSKHEGFSSNPLLLTIMLVTYEQFGDIPDKVHIFYNLAYQALFNMHDVSKQGFRRKSLANLDMYELKNIFSLFCLITYSKQEFYFSDTDLDEYLKLCISKFKYETEYKNLKLELLNNVPLLMRDGLNYCFTHRSFQEYFTAYYLTNNKASMQIFSKIGARYRSDSIIDMMFDMNREVLEDNWILPEIDNIIGSAPTKIETIEERISALLLFYTSITSLNSIDDETGEVLADLGYLVTKNSSFLEFLIRKYNYDDLASKFRDEYRLDTEAEAEAEARFIEEVLSFQDPTDIHDLDYHEKELLCDMGSDVLGKANIELIIHIKNSIIELRTESKDSIEAMIFDLPSD